MTRFMLRYYVRLYALRILSALTDGRPMEVHFYTFTDVVTNRRVYVMRDLKGRWWLAEHRWSLFRTEAKGYA